MRKPKIFGKLWLIESTSQTKWKWKMILNNFFFFNNRRIAIFAFALELASLLWRQMRGIIITKGVNGKTHVSFTRNLDPVQYLEHERILYMLNNMRNK